MKIRFPGSFLRLLLIGFALAVLPLIWAFVNASLAFDRLTKDSEVIISAAVKTTHASRIMQEQLGVMERSIRQYFVLQDDSFFDNYMQAEQLFNTASAELRSIVKNPALQDRLGILQAQSAILNQTILTSKQSHSGNLDFLDTFNELSQQIETIIATNANDIDQASAALTHSARKTQRSLWKYSLILIPLALLVAAIITLLLALPIRRMDNAIKDLGEGKYEQPITIDGPGDLRILGKRLDWLRTELMELNMQKQQFLQHVSHELKTPLTAIREATELLHDGIGGALSPQQAEITHILRDNSVRLQKMIENLLNYTKMEAIKPTLHLSTVHFEEVVDKVIRGHALSIRNKKITMEKELSLNKSFEGDEEKLTIILDNLISNAVKYTPESGYIKIRAIFDKKWLVFAVQDSGPGLKKEERDKLFDPFYRGSSLHKGLVDGSGLGLTIAKNLVATHGGNIRLLDSAEGAHFVVRLPVA